MKKETQSKGGKRKRGNGLTDEEETVETRERKKEEIRRKRVRRKQEVGE